MANKKPDITKMTPEEIKAKKKEIAEKSKRAWLGHVDPGGKTRAAQGKPPKPQKPVHTKPKPLKKRRGGQ